MEVIGRAGFDAVKVRARFDAFGGTSKERVARKFGVQGANVFAVRAGGMR